MDGLSVLTGHSLQDFCGKLLLSPNWQVFLGRRDGIFLEGKQNVIDGAALNGRPVRVSEAVVEQHMQGTARTNLQVSHC